MDELGTARAFLEWILTGAGLVVIVPFIVQPIKKYLKWEGTKARVLMFLVSGICVLGAYFGLKYNLVVYVEEYWPLVLIWWAFVGSGAHAVYKKMPHKGTGQ